MDSRLLDILVCPLCHGPLEHRRGEAAADGVPPEGELVCRHDRLAFPLRDGMPRMLVDEARKLGDAE